MPLLIQQLLRRGIRRAGTTRSAISNLTELANDAPPRLRPLAFAIHSGKVVVQWLRRTCPGPSPLRGSGMLRPACARLCSPSAARLRTLHSVTCAALTQRAENRPLRKWAPLAPQTSAHFSFQDVV